MSDWYHAKNGKSIGPFSFEDMVSLVEKEEIGAMDLVFKTGEKEWRPLKEWAEFSFMSQIKNESLKVSHWIVYIRTGAEDKKIGPLSSELVQDRLAKGEIGFEDFIWKEGMSDWYQIKNIKEFQSKSAETSLDESKDVKIANEKEIYSESAADLLKNVKIKDAKQVREITQTLTRSLSALTSKKDIKNLDVENEDKTKKNNDRENFKKFESAESESVKDEKDEGVKIEVKKETAFNRKELLEKRRELEDLLNKVFGESRSGEDLTKFEKAKFLSKSVEDLTNQLPLKKELRERGYFKKEKIVGDAIDEAVESSHEEDKSRQQQLVNYIEKFSPEKKYNRQGVLQKIVNEIDAIFPRGSLLRLFALFFTIFTFAIILILSSYSDQKKRGLTDVEAKKSLDRENTKELSDREILAEMNSGGIKKPLRHEEKAETLKSQKPPSRLDIFLDKREGQLDLIFKTDASSDYSVEVKIWADVKDVLGKGGYYYKDVINGGASNRINLLRINVPVGILNVEARVGDLSKKLRLNNYENKKSFEKDLNLNKKQVAIWHQKEKRSLYAAVNQLSDYALQLQSLTPLASQGRSRWSKAYKNLKTRVSQSRSSYLRQVNDKVEGGLVYPLIWLKVLEMEKEMLGLDSDPLGFDYLSFKKRIHAAELEVAELSLW